VLVRYFTYGIRHSRLRAGDVSGEVS
jgi:hypothetical protein